MTDLFHLDELSQDSVICVVKIRSVGGAEITTTLREFYPDSSLFGFTL